MSSVRCVFLITLAACAVEVGGAADEGVNAEDVQGTAQMLWTGWGPLDDQANIVGIARAPIFGAKPYLWYDDGTGCRGTSQSYNVCGESTYNYSAPGSFSSIRAVAIAQDTSHVYAWYSDSTVSQGTSTNFSAYNGKLSFGRPAKPGGGLFSMSELVDADHNGSNGWVYYFWLSGGTLYRTLGTSRDADSHSSAQIVTWSAEDGTIRGISFLANWIEAWYSSGWVNVSNSSLNLAQE
jgi:hypothetical protein